MSLTATFTSSNITIRINLLIPIEHDAKVSAHVVIQSKKGFLVCCHLTTLLLFTIALYCLMKMSILIDLCLGVSLTSLSCIRVGVGVLDVI